MQFFNNPLFIRLRTLQQLHVSIYGHMIEWLKCSLSDQETLVWISPWSICQGRSDFLMLSGPGGGGHYIQHLFGKCLKTHATDWLKPFWMTLDRQNYLGVIVGCASRKLQFIRIKGFRVLALFRLLITPDDGILFHSSSVKFKNGGSWRTCQVSEFFKIILTLSFMICWVPSCPFYLSCLQCTMDLNLFSCISKKFQFFLIQNVFFLYFYFSWKTFLLFFVVDTACLSSVSDIISPVLCMRHTLHGPVDVSRDWKSVQWPCWTP